MVIDDEENREEMTNKVNQEPYPPRILEKPDPILEVMARGGTPCISFHTLIGVLVPSTLKIIGRIHFKEVVVLIDGGSTNNFI